MSSPMARAARAILVNGRRTAPMVPLITRTKRSLGKAGALSKAMSLQRCSPKAVLCQVASKSKHLIVQNLTMFKLEELCYREPQKSASRTQRQSGSVRIFLGFLVQFLVAGTAEATATQLVEVDKRVSATQHGSCSGGGD